MLDGQVAERLTSTQRVPGLQIRKIVGSSPTLLFELNTGAWSSGYDNGLSIRKREFDSPRSRQVTRALSNSEVNGSVV